MSTIYYLNSGDFIPEGNHLVANIGGITFIMFHSQRCNHCMTFLPQFKQLPGAIRGINFGLCNVDENQRKVVKMSTESSTPITAVPKFILYNEGVPFAEYSGQRSRQAILTFLQDMISKIGQPQQFARPRRSRQQNVAPQPGPPQAPGMVPHPNQAPPQQQPFQITPSTGVKEYDTSYGRPYNTLNESDFLEYETAYKQQMQGK